MLNSIAMTLVIILRFTHLFPKFLKVLKSEDKRMIIRKYEQKNYSLLIDGPNFSLHNFICYVDDPNSMKLQNVSIICPDILKSDT